jgi:transcription-repair coupling factor (superfamily II helicase)
LKRAVSARSKQLGAKARRRGPQSLAPQELSSAAPLGAIAVALLAAWKSSGRRGLLFLSESERRAEHLGSILNALEPASGVMVLPRWDSLPYDGTPPSREVSGRRASVLRRLSVGESPPFLLATAESCLQRVPPKHVWKEAVLELRPDMPISEQLIAEFLARTGYALEPRVEMPGEASLRGQVVDVFPAGSLAPVRVEHENGRIIQLSSYDPDTQRTTGELKVVVLEPASEIIHSAVPQVPQDATTARAIAQHYGTSATLFDYIPKAHVIADPTTASRVSGWLQQIKEGYEARRATGDCVSLEPPTSIFLDELSWAAALGSHKLASLSPSAPAPQMLVPKFALEPSPTRAFRGFIQQQIAAKHLFYLPRPPIAISLQSSGAPATWEITGPSTSIRLPARLLCQQVQLRPCGLIWTLVSFCATAALS